MWYINNIKFVVQEEQEDAKQLIARLNPIQSDTIYHVFGWDTEIVKLGGKVVGDEDREAIKALRKTGLAYVISGPEGTLGNYLVNNISFKRDHCISQTIRPDLPCDAPVYSFDMELYYDS